MALVTPCNDFILEYADQYIAIDSDGSYHNTKADIAADLNILLPIESEVADTVISLSVMKHLCKPQTMLNVSINHPESGGLSCKYRVIGGYAKRHMTFYMGLNNCLKKRVLSMLWLRRNQPFLQCRY